jgi:copper chaperone
MTMRYWVFALVLLTFAATHSIAQTRDDAATAVCTLKITGMTCGGCEGAVRVAAKKVDGVKGVTASHKAGTAEVTYDPAKTSPEAIAKVVTDKSGFKAEVVKKK